MLNFEPSNRFNRSVISINWYKGRNFCAGQRAKARRAKRESRRKSDGVFLQRNLPTVFLSARENICTWTEWLCISGCDTPQSPSKGMPQLPQGAAARAGLVWSAGISEAQDAPGIGFFTSTAHPTLALHVILSGKWFAVVIFSCASSAVCFGFVLWRNFSEGNFFWLSTSRKKLKFVNSGAKPQC